MYLREKCNGDLYLVDNIPHMLLKVHVYFEVSLHDLKMSSDLSVHI
jgi:hypothetical protein